MNNSIILDAQSLGLPISSASHLSERYTHLLEALSTENAAGACDHSKTFLETIFRTIITDRNGEIRETSGQRASFVELYRQTCECLDPHESDAIFLPIVKKGATVIADMRDNYGSSSHGQDGYHERRVELAEATFLVRLSLVIASYVYSRHKHSTTSHENSRLHYEDNSSFNEYLDSEGDVEVAGIFVVPSKVLFDNDPIAYKEQLLEYTNDVYVDEIEAAAESWFELQSDIARGK